MAGKIITGTVVSTAMDKTIVVEVERKVQHHRYKKTVKNNRRLKAHCDSGAVKVGDVVSIQEVAPLSKDKHFTVVRS